MNKIYKNRKATEKAIHIPSKIDAKFYYAHVLPMLFFYFFMTDAHGSSSYHRVLSDILNKLVEEMNFLFAFL